MSCHTDSGSRCAVISHTKKILASCSFELFPTGIEVQVHRFSRTLSKLNLYRTRPGLRVGSRGTMHNDENNQIQINITPIDSVMSRDSMRSNTTSFRRRFGTPSTHDGEESHATTVTEHSKQEEAKIKAARMLTPVLSRYGAPAVGAWLAVNIIGGRALQLKKRN